MTRDAGFSLVETLVATTVTMSLMTAMVSLVSSNVASSPVLPESIDLTQRALVAGDTLAQELSRAGAGLSAGARPGPLVDSFAPVVPRRMGIIRPDVVTTSRADTVTIRYASQAASASVTAFTPSASPQVALTPAPGCPSAPLCGLVEGTDVFVFDSEGHGDTFTVQQALGGMVSLEPHDVPASHQYVPGSAVAEGISRTYYFDPAQRQLRVYDGNQTDAPVVDGVVGVTFSYYGDPNPPVAPQPSLGTANCLYDTAGRLNPALVVLPAAGQALVPLRLSLFGDGPWCGSGPAAFDADLLRVRYVRVSLRLEAMQASFRGLGAAFAHPGTATSAASALADATVTFDVAPRNLNLRR